MSILHDNCRHVDIDFDALVGQDASSVHVDLVTDCNIVAEHADVLQARPFADGGVPANDGALDPGVILDLGICKQDTSLQTDTIPNNDAWTNGDIGPDSAVLPNLRAGVNQNVATVDVWEVRRREKFRALLCKGG